MQNERYEGLRHAGRARVDMTAADDADLSDVVRKEADSVEGREAFAELYRRHRDVTMAQAYRMTGDRDRAEDLVAEVFARTLRALSRGNGPHDSVLGYLLISVRSEAIRTAKVGAATVSMEPEALAELFDESTPDFADELSERDQVTRAFQQLPSTARRALWLVDVEQVPNEQAAEHLEMSIGALRVLSHRSRKRLGTEYLQQYVEVARPGCREFAENLAHYSRGTLGRAETRRITEHLLTCTRCSEQLTRLGGLQAQLRAWIGPVAGAGGLGAAAAVVGNGATAEAAVGATRFKVAVWAGFGVGAALLLLGVLALIPPGSGLRQAPFAEDRTDAPTVSTPAPTPVQTVVPGVEADSQQAPPADDTTPFWRLRDDDGSSSGG